MCVLEREAPIGHICEEQSEFNPPEERCGLSDLFVIDRYDGQKGTEVFSAAGGPSRAWMRKFI